MNEREIFAKALELETETERASFLRQVCGHDSEMRNRISELLAGVDSLGIDSPGTDSLDSDIDRLSTLDLKTQGFQPQKSVEVKTSDLIGP